MAEMLHVGILGAGWAAEGHAAAYSQLPDVEVNPYGIAPAPALKRLQESSGTRRRRCMTTGGSCSPGPLRCDQHRHRAGCGPTGIAGGEPPGPTSFCLADESS